MSGRNVTVASSTASPPRKPCFPSGASSGGQKWPASTRAGDATEASSAARTHPESQHSPTDAAAVHGEADEALKGAWVRERSTVV